MVTGFLDIGHVVKQVVAGSLDFGIIRVGCEMMPSTARFHIMLAIHLSPGMYFDSGCLALGYHFCALHHICACSSHHEALFFLHPRSLSLWLCCVLCMVCCMCCILCYFYCRVSQKLFQLIALLTTAYDVVPFMVLSMQLCSILDALAHTSPLILYFKLSQLMAQLLEKRTSLFFLFPFLFVSVWIL